MSGVTCWFRPTFDLPIPPIYQPSTIETVARDRSPRLGKTGNSDFGNPKKMGETMSNSAEIYIYQSLSKLEVTLFLRTSKFLKTKYLDEVSFWGRFTESWKTVYMQHLLARVSSHAKNRRPIACQNWHCWQGGVFLSMMSRDQFPFHSVFQSQALWYWKGSFKALWTEPPWSVGGTSSWVFILYGKQSRKMLLFS